MNRRLMMGTAAAALSVAMAPAALAQDDGYVIGVSNTVQGNGWREEMICAMRAQALVLESPYRRRAPLYASFRNNW